MSTDTKTEARKNYPVANLMVLAAFGSDTPVSGDTLAVTKA